MDRPIGEWADLIRNLSDLCSDSILGIVCLVNLLPNREATSRFGWTYRLCTKENYWVGYWVGARLNNRREVGLDARLDTGLGSMPIIHNDSLGEVKHLEYGGLASCKFHATSLSLMRPRVFSVSIMYRKTQ